MAKRDAAWGKAHEAREKPVPPLFENAAFEEWVMAYALPYGDYEQAQIVLNEIARQRAWPEPRLLGTP